MISASSGSASIRNGRGRLPRFRPPQLATLADALPQGEWVFETKFDGYRMLAAVNGTDVRCYTRTGLDWTDRFASLAAALARLKLGPSLLDGEVVAAGESGRADFGALQAALKESQSGRLRYFIFDAQKLNGEIIEDLPFSTRRRRLERALSRVKSPLHLTTQLKGGADRVYAAACERGWEGLIAKRLNVPYRHRRTRDWLKLKCVNGEEFVIGGWSPSTRGRPFSSILLGVRKGGKLVYRGRVGAGFDEKMLLELSAKFGIRARKSSPFAEVPREVVRKANWLTPDLVAQVKFTELTSAGHIRHGVFVGLREDKKSRDVTGEKT